MKRFVMLLILTALLLTGCMKTEPATVATISPAHEAVAEEGTSDNGNVRFFYADE